MTAGVARCGGDGDACIRRRIERHLRVGKSDVPGFGTPGASELPAESGRFAAVSDLPSVHPRHKKFDEPAEAARHRRNAPLWTAGGGNPGLYLL